MADEKEMTFEEEDTHIKRGAWVGLILFPFILLCICGIFAITPGGRASWYALMVPYSYSGAPGLESLQIPYSRGLTGVARAQCALDKKKPRPNNYESIKEGLVTEYKFLFDLYGDNWRKMKKAGGDMSEYEKPGEVVANLLGATRRYCRR